MLMFWVLAAVIVTFDGSSAQLEETEILESSLKRRLLAGYKPSSRPVRNASTTVVTEIGIALNQIITVDEREQAITGKFWLRLFWKDELLQWNETDYNGIQQFKLFPNQVWVPDITLYDSLLENALHATVMRDYHLTVDHTGAVRWLAPAVIKFFCPINVRLFPFDVQLCKMKFGSWSYNGFELDLWNRSENGDLSVLKRNSEWDIISMPLIRNNLYYLCCAHPYPDITYTLILCRKPLFYLMNLYLPPCVIAVTSFFGFFLPAESGEKIALSITGVLSQTVFLLILSNLLPPDSDKMPLIGQCLMGIICLQALAVVATIWILSFHHHSAHCKRRPPFMGLANVLKYPMLLPHLEFSEAKILSQDTETKWLSENLPPSQVKTIGCAPIKQAPSSTDNGVTVAPISNGRPTWSAESADPSETCSQERLVLLREIRCNVQLMVTAQRKKRESKVMQDMWMKVALVLDRTCFGLFIVSIGGLSWWFLSHNTEQTDIVAALKETYGS